MERNRIDRNIEHACRDILPEHPVDMGHVAPPDTTPPEAYTVNKAGIREFPECPFP